MLLSTVNSFINKRPTGMQCVKVTWLDILLFILFHASFGEVRYSVPEEMKQGSFIGDVARDLGVNVADLNARRARIVAEGTRQLCKLDSTSGSLLVSERIDREELCAQASVCLLQYQLLLEDPLKVYSLVLDIQDVNDNTPFFATGEIDLELVESTVLGRRFPLESAHDPDLGTSSVRDYTLSPNEHFALEMSSQMNGNAYPELVLRKALDRETQAEYTLTINGIDGGSPARTGSASIRIRVLDANDNVPVFRQRVYKASVLENSARGALVALLNATDLDEGVYGEITYSFSRMSEKTRGVFEIDPASGEVRVSGLVDYEEASAHELDIQAKDGGGQASHCKLMIEVIDVNDNEPIIAVKSASATVAEDSKPGTMVALLNVHDLDTGNSGRVTCTISDGVPFKLISEVKNYYMLVTDGLLDREMYPVYNITVVAVDAGSPSLSSRKLVSIVVNDVNDNPPTFTQEEYSAKVWENQPTGTFVTRVTADDLDTGSNARILYTISDNAGQETSSLLSVNAETGELYTSRQFDYEQSVYYQVQVTARDGGDPPLSSTCIVRIFIGDHNDNTPVVLYPVQSSSYIAEDMVPLEAPKGYLVTKVVAVDADSGHNAWLSYRVVKATQPNLFTIGLHCGEIRTLRAFLEGDEERQTLVILVTDNGPGSLSTTATVNVVIGDSLPVLPELFEVTDDPKAAGDFTLYLIIALATVSSLLLLLISAVMYYRICRRGYAYRAATSSLPVFPSAYCPPSYAEASRCGTLLKDDQYDSFLTTGSWKGDFRFGSSRDTDTLKKRSAAYQKNTLRRLSAERAAGLKQKPPNNDWRFNQGQRPGPSGAAGGPEVAMGTGPWPNPPTEAEQLQALMAAANVSEATATLGPGTMGLSTRYSPQFTLQHVPDYRQNVYIPGSTATLTSNPQQQLLQQQQMQLQAQAAAAQQALPPAQAQAQPEPPKAAQTPASKKKSTKKEKK